MPINKFTTLLDLARQAKIITGETATFDGKIQAGIPFSGYPTGVDTGTTVSLGVVSSEDAVFSGNSGTTIFDVANTGSTNYSPIFSGYTASTWTNPLFSGNTSGLTLPITPLSADTQIVGPFWTLTQTGMTGDYVIGTQYTGYSVTYSFFNVSQLGTGFTYSGFTTASQENFSAGTLDYKGPLDYISTKEDASVEGRLTTNKLTVTGGASSATTGYVLTQTGDTGEVGWVFNSASGTTDTNLANSNLIQSAATRTYTLPAGYRLQFKDNSNFNMLELGEAAGQVTVNGSSQDIDFVAVGLTDSNLLRTDATNDRVGIGTPTPTEKLHIDGGDILVTNTSGRVFTDIENSDGPNLGLSGNTTGLTRISISEPASGGVVIGVRGASEPSFPGYGKQSDSFIYSSIVSNGLNIISQPGTGTDDYIRFFVGQAAGAAGTPDLYIQGTGTTRGNVGINTDNPTEKLVVDGNVKIIGNAGAVTRSLTIGDDDEITFTTLGSSITDNVNIISQTNNAKINLKNGTINDRFTELAQYNTYGALAFNVGDTGNSETFIVNDSVSGFTAFRVGDEDFLSDIMYLFGKKSEDKLGPFTGVTDSKVVFIKEYLSVAENLSIGSVGSTAFANDIRIDANGILTTNTSDERLKENINNLNGSLETILQLSGVSYNWVDRISGGDDIRYGFIAQRVDEVDPNLTTTNQVDGYMGLKSDCFTPLIVESIKEIYNNPSIPNYTPSSSGDTYGSVGNVTIDDDYLYVKTNNGWKRTTLESF